MGSPRRSRKVSLICATLVAASLSGCATEYHGFDSGLDGVLWRQVASFEDPLSRKLYSPEVNTPVEYLAALPGIRWDGTSASTSDLTLNQGGVLLYDVEVTDSIAELSVFIASGPRPESRAKPSEVFTCYGIEADFNVEPAPTVGRVLYSSCPAALVELLRKDAAFASGEVFDG